MKSVLTWLLGLFTYRWGLKILSLALAIIIYHSLKPAEGSRQNDHDDSILFKSR